VKGDGVINVLDVRLCQQIAEGVIQGTAAQRYQADMNTDSQVNLADAQLLAEYLIGIGTP
jgi:glucose-6-phosphate-specific signal transduction histidine kinase